MLLSDWISGALDRAAFEALPMEAGPRVGTDERRPDGRALHAGRHRLMAGNDDRESVASLVQICDMLGSSCDQLESEGLDRFLESVVRHAVEIAGAALGWLALPSADESQLELVGPFQRDMRRGGLVAVEGAGRTIPLARFAREVWQAGRSASELHWLRCDESRLTAAKPGWSGIRSDRESLLVPVRLGGTTFGHLVLIFRSQDRPPEARVHAARVLAQQAAAAIRIQRLGDTAREAAGRSAAEAERERLAGEIHDGLAQAFLAVIMQARAARLGGRMRKQNLLQFLEQIESLAAGGLEESRRSVFALRASSVEREGLLCALERLVGSLSIAGRTQFVLVNRAGAPDIAAAAEDALYRIVQEATQNALKHAGARLVTVRLDEEAGRLRVRIEDDGEGVAHDVIQHARERGGLRAMRERAEHCGGSLIVEAGSPRGTRVEVLLPMRTESP